MYIRSQDKKTLLNFSGGKVFQDGRYIVYSSETNNNGFNLAQYQTIEKAEIIFDLLAKSCSGNYFDLSAYIET